MQTTTNGQLLKITEKLSENLSSSQIIKTLDGLIFNGLESVINNTNFMEYVATELIVHIFQNARRKFSNKPTQEIKDALFTFIVKRSKKGKAKIIRNLTLERTIYFRIFSMIEEDSTTYIRLMEEYLATKDKTILVELSRIEKKYRSITDNFYLMCMESMFWYQKSYYFRNMIVEKYVRLAYTEANKSVSEISLNVCKDDLTRDLIVAIFKAIDKYDPEKGTLTNYIKRWFMDAKTQKGNRHEYGIAFEIPVTQRKKILEAGGVNIAEPLDDKVMQSVEDSSDNVLDKMARDQEMTILNNVASRVDRYKAFCLLNNIQYQLDNQDVQTLKSTL